MSSLKIAQSHGARVVLTLYYNPFDVNFPNGFNCGDLTSIGSTTVNTIDSYLYDRAHANGFLTADLRGPFTSHGAGSSQNYTFGTHCDLDSILWAARLNWASNDQMMRELESKFDPHPNNAGTCAIAQTIATTLGDAQPNCSTTNLTFSSVHTKTTAPVRSAAHTFDEAVNQCSQTARNGAFGSAYLDQNVIVAHENLTIPVPCAITLAAGVALTINDSHIQAHNLIIRDTEDAATAHPTRVKLHNSQLTGVGHSGLLVRLANPVDEITVDTSTIDFPLSVWLGAGSGGQANAAGGTVQVSASSIRSVDPNSQGIQLLASAASGSLGVNNSTLTTSYLDHIALLYAHSCQQQHVIGSTPVCSPIGPGNGNKRDSGTDNREH